MTPFAASAATLGYNTANPSYTKMGYQLSCTGGADCKIQLHTFGSPTSGNSFLDGATGYLVGISFDVYASTTDTYMARQAGQIITYTDTNCSVGAQLYSTGNSYILIPGVGTLGFKHYDWIATTTAPVPVTGVGCITYNPTSASPTESWYTITSADGVPGFVMIGSSATSSWELNTTDWDSFVSKYTGGPNDYSLDCAFSLNIFASSTASLPACIKDLVGWPTDAIIASLTDSVGTFIEAFPIGYVTRFVKIVSGSATGTVPVLTLSLPQDLIGGQGLGGTTTIDFQAAMDSSANVLDTPDQYGNSFWSVVMPIWQVFAYTSLVIAIILHAIGAHFLHQGIEAIQDNRRRS